MKIAIVGSRKFRDLEIVKDYISFELFHVDTVISGGAKGVDTAAIEEAKDIGLKYEVYPADWDRHGKGAGYIRNKVLVDKADEVVAFWDGESKGTKHTIELALAAQKRLTVIF